MTTPDIPFPRVLRIEPASQCNLACKHCPTGTVEMDRGVMPESIINSALQELEKNLDSIKIIVLYHGGEPLLNSRFYQIVEAIKTIKSTLYIKTVTNGMALNERNAMKLIESGIDAIEISLDGSSASESQQIRKHSDTEKIVANIKKLILMRTSLNSKTPTISLATTQFAKTKQEFPLPSAPVPDWLRVEFGDTVDYKATYAVRWPHMNVGGGFDLLASPSEYGNGDCDHALNTITIRSDGNVVPCCYDLTSKLVMGNIMTQSLRSIWYGESYQQLRDSLAQRAFYSICRTCAVVNPPIYLIQKNKIRIPITPTEMP